MEDNKTSKESIKILNRRSFIIIFISLFFSLFVILRLFSLQIINSKFYKKKSIENKVSVKAIPPLRGDIFDNNNNLLAGSTSSYEFVIFKNLNKKFIDELNSLNSILSLDLNLPKMINEINKKNPYVPYKISKAGWDQIVKFEKNKFLFTAIKIQESKKRYYPHKNMSQILGYTGSSSLSSELYPKGVFHIEKRLKIL